MTTTWFEELKKAGLNFEDVASSCVVSVNDEDLHREWDEEAFANDENVPVLTAWTINDVYFSHSYDGKVSLKRVPRFPDKKLNSHVGSDE